MSASDPLQTALLSSLLDGRGAAAGGVDLQSLLGGPAGVGTAAPLDLAGLVAARVAEAGPGDERMALVQRWMESRQAAAQPAPVEAGTDTVVDETPTPAERELEREAAARDERERRLEQRAGARELKALLQSLYAEVAALRARNDAIAAGLGACHLCFGDDPTCPECTGRGTPGSLMPDASEFRRYVTPAVRRVRASVPARAGPPYTGPPYTGPPHVAPPYAAPPHPGALRADRYAPPAHDPPSPSAYHPTPGALP